MHPVESTLDQSTKDYEEDIVMTGVNALLAMLSKNNNSTKVGAPLGGKIQPQDYSSRYNRPRALWRTHQEFMKLISDGLCARCTNLRYTVKQCLNFRPVARAKTALNSASISQIDENSNSEKVYPLPNSWKRRKRSV